MLDGLDLDIHTGLTTVVCGVSGSGKSVLLRLMNGLTLPDDGRVLLFGEDTRTLDALRLIQLRKRVSMLFQSYALMDSLTVIENIAFPLYENTQMGWKDITGLVTDLLGLLDLADAGGKMPSELSGGMKKRVSLARSVISNPEVVLFDEPTTGLDPIMIEFVDEMIERTQEHFGITSVVISHDMTSTLRLADRVAMLDEGRIVQYGTLNEVMGSGEPLVDVFFEGAGDRLDATSGSPVQVSDRTTPEGAMVPEDEVIVRVDDIYKRFGTHQVLRGVSLEIPRNRITVLIGGSGSGKSVTMKHIIGIFKPDKGRVSVFGQDITRLSEVALIPIRARFGMLFQGAALLDSMTVWENVAFPLQERRCGAQEVAERTEETLLKLRIQDLSSRYPSEISNGERKRVGLARAIVMRPQIMIYDEPTTGQDPVMARYVDDMIVEAQELFDITSLVVSHDMLSTFRVGHQVAFLHQGKIRACGSPDEVKSSDDPYVRRFIYAGTAAGDDAAHAIAAMAAVPEGA